MLYIVLPVHNRVAVTLHFIASLCAQTYQDFVLVLVDDGSTDGTADAVCQQLPTSQLVVLRGDGSLWWAGALQQAYDYLSARDMGSPDSVLIINDDVEFEADFLAHGVNLLGRHPDACIQALGVDKTSGEVDRGIVADTIRLSFRAAEVGEPPNCLSTRGLLMSSRTFVDSGGFRPKWLPHYLSDYEFTMRLKRQGVSLLCDETFRTVVDFAMTGEAHYRGAGLREFMTVSFSNRAKFNPMHWSAFIALACPSYMVPYHWTLIWLRFVWAMLRALRNGWIGESK